MYKQSLIEALRITESVLQEAKRNGLWAVYRKAVKEKAEIESALALINREEKAKREAERRRMLAEALEKDLLEARKLRQKERELESLLGEAREIIGKPTGIPVDNRRRKPPIQKKLLRNTQQPKASAYRPFEGLKGLTI